MSRSPVLVLIISILSLCACEKGAEEDNVPVVLYDSVAYEACLEVCDTSFNRNKTVAVFGGSISSMSQSEKAKNLWREHLGMKVVTFGVGSAGFVNPDNNIKMQIQRAGKFDIYILWCSTNDFTYDYPHTTVAMQNEKMNECIDMLQTKNPQAKIYVFTSLKGFLNKGWTALADFANGQMKVAQNRGLKYLNLYNLDYNTEARASLFYQSDKVHPNSNGYYNFGWRILYFLATEKMLASNFYPHISDISELEPLKP